MKALVTGGAGFIGSNLTRRLMDNGHDVVVFDDLSSGYRKNLDFFPSERFVHADVRDAQAMAQSAQGIEVIFHLAASVGNKRSIDHPLHDAEVNVLGTLNVLESARIAGVRKVVFSSSAGIFGELKTLPIREDHPVEPDSPYGASKLAAEKLCLVYGKLHPIEIACLRYFNVYGPNQRYDAYGNVIPIFAHRALRGEPLVIYGDGEQTRDFINVQDVVQANILAATPRVTGAFNVSSGTSVTINGLVNLLRDALGTPVTTENAAPRAGDVRHSLADISAAREAMGFKPLVGLKEGLADYVAWMRGEGVQV